MDEDIQFFEKVLNNDFSDITRYSISINSNFFKTQKLSKSNAYVRAVLLMMSKEAPLDLTNGRIIDTGLALSVYNRKEYHHIFPKAFLKSEFSLDDDKINVIGNFCFFLQVLIKLFLIKDLVFILKKIFHKEKFLKF